MQNHKLNLVSFICSIFCEVFILFITLKTNCVTISLSIGHLGQSQFVNVKHSSKHSYTDGGGKHINASC